MIGFVQTNRHLLTQRPICSISTAISIQVIFYLGQTGISRFWILIDMTSETPWEEFNRMIFTASLSPALACGQIDSYFEENIPEKFWTMLALPHSE